MPWASINSRNCASRASVSLSSSSVCFSCAERRGGAVFGARTVVRRGCVRPCVREGAGVCPFVGCLVVVVGFGRSRENPKKAIVPTMPQPSSNGLVCSIGPIQALMDEGCCQQMVQNMLASGRSHSIEVVSSPNGTLEVSLEPPFRGLSGAAPRRLIGARVAMHKRAHCCQGPHQNLRTDPTDRLGFGDQNPSLLIWLR